MAGNNIR